MENNLVEPVSEGRCPTCGGSLDISGTCSFCTHLEEIVSSSVPSSEHVACALCGKKHHRSSAAYNTVYKKNDHTLSSDFYHPHLDQEELVILPTKESYVCTDRRGCRTRRLAKL